MWEAAQLDNPDPSKFIPVPMFGFLDLRKRMLCQQYETSLHKAYLQKFAKDMDELSRRKALSMVKLGEAKQGLFELQHRVLRVCQILIKARFYYTSTRLNNRLIFKKVYD